MAVLKDAASESLAFFTLAIVLLRYAVYRFVQFRAQDVGADAKLRAALNELVPEACDTDEAILETTTSQIYDAVVYRRRRQKIRNANRSAARQVG